MIKRPSLLFTALLLLLGLTGGCDSSEPDPPSDFFFEAHLNGEPFSGKAWAELDADSTNRLYVAGNEYADVSPKNYIGDPAENQVGIRIHNFDGEGTYPIKAEEGNYFTLIGGDVLGESYESYGADDDFIVITEFDGDQQIVEGTVEMRLQHTEDSSEVIAFASGRFRAQLKCQSGVEDLDLQRPEKFPISSSRTRQARLPDAGSFCRSHARIRRDPESSSG